MIRKLTAIAITVCLAMPSVSVFAVDGNLNIKDYLEKSLPPQDGRRLAYNESTKLLTVTDTKSNQELIKKLIKGYEVGPKQVMIETRFVEIAVSDLEELGIEWDFYHKGNVNGKGRSNGFTVGNAAAGTSSFSGRQYNLDDKVEYSGVHWNDDVSSLFPAVGNFAGQFALYKILENSDSFAANLRFLAQQGKVNLLSSPKVTTISGQMANIQIVRVYPYVSDFTLENTGTAEFPIWNYKLTLAEKPIGIFLETTPYVTEGSNTITLDLHPEVSVLQSQVAISNLRASGETGTLGNVTSASAIRLIPTDLGWPVVDVRTTQTSVAVDSGETIVLGGLIRDTEQVTKRKVPFLGDIPLLGKAFQYDYRSQTKTNLLIFITASIIDASGEVVR